MSAETHVLFQGKLPGTDEIDRAMAELGFPFTIKPLPTPLDRQRGFMPMLFGKEDTGVEFDMFEGREAVEDLAADRADLDPAIDRCASFRWGGDFTEAVAGMCAAAALAKLVSATVLDEYEEDPLDAEGAIRVARENLAILLEEKGAAAP